MIFFASPLALLLLLILPLFVFLVKRFEKNRKSAIRFGETVLLDNSRKTMRLFLMSKIVYLRAACLALIILALARPRSSVEETRVFVEGIDIVLAMDTSTSMRAMDFEMGGRRFDRLAVVKTVVEEFVKERPNDRIGIVAFASEAYTVCPLTLDHDWLDKNLERVEIGMVEDGTAIGTAITASLNRIKDTKTKDKIIILLTDGRNNAGKVSPLVAALAAKALGVRIYTIGAGTKGLAPYPFKDPFGEIVLRPVEIEIDDALLKKIADTTGGRYFRATGTSELWDIYKEIDKLEKTPMEETGYNKYKELFPYLLFPALFILVFEIVLSNTVFRRIP